MLRCDPDRAAGIEQAALDARGVWFDHRTSTATTDVTARLDTLDALDLQASVATSPASWAGSGTTAPHDLRQATALGLLAHPQRALDLAASTASASAGSTAHDTAAAPAAPTRSAVEPG